jgi:integral membrane protein (TIGR01906 family)
VAGILRWVVALAMPVFLVLSVARVCIQDWYPRYEYAKPDFPRDPYGWTKQERLDLLLPTYRFLNSPQLPEQAIKILADQRMPASDFPLFTAEELSHMVDVKRVIDGCWRAQVISGLLILAALGVLLARRATRSHAYVGLMFGGMLTVGFLVMLGLFMLVGFDSAFVLFHDVFFPQGNWTFDYTSSLIRMLPERYFFDYGVLIAGGALLAGLVVTGAGWLLKRGAHG